MAAKIKMPATAKKGDVVEVKVLIDHAMETGQRKGADGALIPRKIINKFVCTYNGKQVMQADYHPAISANPFMSFFLAASESGEVKFQWFDDDGSVQEAVQKITVE
ncbi:MAG: thiosulfate oxidation carrier complex protein SoxZ [Alphaproteobacteria bacterium]|nr:thiosulfate oxidation carrier complex protein SoxZ [Alphaproteobacteria bacterium]